MTVVPREALDELHADITKFFNKINTANNYGPSVVPNFYVIGEQRWFDSDGLRAAAVSSASGADQPVYVTEMLLERAVERFTLERYRASGAGE